MQCELFSELDTDPDLAADGREFPAFQLPRARRLGSPMAGAERAALLAPAQPDPRPLLPPPALGDLPRVRGEDRDGYLR